MKVQQSFLALCALLSLLASPVTAQGQTQPLEGKVEHSDSIEPAPAQLMQGAKFDQSALPAIVSKNNWTPIPKWLAGTWQFKTETVTHMRLFTKGDFPPVPFTLHNEFQKVHGYQRDKSGQVWDYIKAPYSYIATVEHGLKGYERIEKLTIVSNNDDEHIRCVVGPDSVIDPDSQTILLTQQKECFNRYTPIGPDAVRLDSSTKIFDMQGQAKLLKISNMLAMRVKPFEEIDEKDGENLKQLFDEYLKANGKADLVP